MFSYYFEKILSNTVQTQVPKSSANGVKSGNVGNTSVGKKKKAKAKQKDKISSSTTATPVKQQHASISITQDTTEAEDSSDCSDTDSDESSKDSDDEQSLASKGSKQKVGVDGAGLLTFLPYLMNEDQMTNLKSLKFPLFNHRVWLQFLPYSRGLFDM